MTDVASASVIENSRVEVAGFRTDAFFLRCKQQKTAQRKPAIINPSRMLAIDSCCSLADLIGGGATGADTRLTATEVKGNEVRGMANMTVSVPFVTV